MMYMRQFLPCLCLALIACNTKSSNTPELNIDRDEESYVMVEIAAGTGAKDLVNAFRTINRDHGHADKKMSSTSV
jgi:hypothetical protein